LIFWDYEVYQNTESVLKEVAPLEINTVLDSESHKVKISNGVAKFINQNTWQLNLF